MARYWAVEEAVKAAENKMGTFREVLAMRREREMAEIPMTHETYEHGGPKCPYQDCGRQYVADEPHYFDDMNYTEDKCDACGRRFTVSVHTSTSWTCETIDP